MCDHQVLVVFKRSIKPPLSLSLLCTSLSCVKAEFLVLLTSFCFNFYYFPLRTTVLVPKASTSSNHLYYPKARLIVNHWSFAEWITDIDHITTPSPIYCLADVKMNHVRGSGAGAQIRASHSQSDPVSLGKTTPPSRRCHQAEKSPLCLLFCLLVILWSSKLQNLGLILK